LKALIIALKPFFFKVWIRLVARVKAQKDISNIVDIIIEVFGIREN
jgi:hypothetical protein